MRRISGLAAAIGLSAAAMGGGKPLASVPKYNGKFIWVKLGNLPSGSVKSLASAQSILVDVSFPRDVRVKKDGHGNQWFTFVLADQGSDWKWHQTKGSGIPVLGGMIKAGTYTVSLPAAGIPNSVLRSKQQTISLGPNTSGLVSPVSFSVDRLTGR